jgi:hypothetical protein
VAQEEDDRTRHDDVSDESEMPFYGPTQFRLTLSLLVPITMNLTWVLWKKKRGHLAPYQALHNLDSSPPSLLVLSVASEISAVPCSTHALSLNLSMLEDKHVLGPNP